jgi:eukaryotic-like serine/threonine-protein kinase
MKLIGGSPLAARRLSTSLDFCDRFPMLAPSSRSPGSSERGYPMNVSSPDDESVFSAALALPSSKRALYLDVACAGDSARRARIESLLSSADESPDFMADAAAPRFIAPAACEIIGRYKLLQKLGEGGCGVVYLAEQDEPVRRRVALKVIKLGMDTKEVIARFEAERQAIARMDHPNIAHVLDAGATDAGRPYFVMELVRGVPITRYCDEHRLGTASRLELFIQICHAVQHAHQKGIIHRDLKPSNILVTLQDGVPVPKVIDFGIAKATQGRLTDLTVFTAFEQFIGTPAYMSPEQAELNGLDVDTRSDIYSLGVLLYELLTGRPPFDPKTLLAAGIDEIRRIIREVDPPRPSTRLGTLTHADRVTVAKVRNTAPAQLFTALRGDLDWIVMRCIEKNRTRRYETANELAIDIQRYLENEPVSARPPSTLYRLGKTFRRHRTVVIASIIVVVALVLGIVTSLTQAVRAQRAEQIAYAEAEISSAISSFLQYDLLGEAAAERQPDREVTLRSAVDRAALKLDSAFPKQPLVEASIRDTVARVYHSLGDYVAMQRHMQRALEIGQQARAPDALLTLESMAGLAEAYRAQGKFAEAEKYFHEAMERQRRTLGLVHRETLISQHGLSLTYAAQGRHREAADLLEHTLEIQQRLLPEKHADDMLTSMNHLGLAYQALGRHPEATALLERALETRQRLFGHEHPDTMSSMHSLAHARRREGRVEEAAALATRAAELQKRILGTDHPMAMRGLNGLAVIRRAQGQLDEAARIGAETLARQQRIVGADNPETLDTMHNLAVTYRELQRLPEALALLERALPARRAALGNEHPEIATTLGEIGRVQLELRQPAAAESRLREAILSHERRNASQGVACLDLKSVLGAVLTAQRRFGEAEPLLLSAYAGLKERESTLISAERASLRLALNGLVELYKANGDAARLHEWEVRRREFGRPAVEQ